MMQRKLITILCAASAVSSWQPISTDSFIPKRSPFQRKEYFNEREVPTRRTSPLLSSTIRPQEEENVDSASKDEPKLCYYKQASSGRWKQRVELKTLEVGQEIVGERITKADLLTAKTGPKIFFECGVGRIDAKGNWQMVSGMMRLGKRFMKPSVVRKKVARLSGKPVSLYVHKVRLGTGELEVVANAETLERELEKDLTKVKNPASPLKVGQELVGKVIDVRDYGCIVDVGANRNGLLHIQKVGSMFHFWSFYHYDDDQFSKFS